MSDKVFSFVGSIVISFNELERFLSYKLRCYRRISNPDKSRSNTRENICK